ncbi:MAG: family 20 glycosylhydrolase [Chloroflexota bacterium]
MPRTLILGSGKFSLPDSALLAINTNTLFSEARLAQRSLDAKVNKHYDIVVGSDYTNTVLSLAIDSANQHAQGYRLTIDNHGIAIIAADAAGIYYGVCTLAQILQQSGKELPVLTIEDWSDFAVRGVMLDISRDKVPTLQTVFDLVDRLASWKINQVQLYMEHTFAYRHHPEVWAQATPFTGEDILELDRFCHERHIELVPNQNSLGHMERWLKFERYAPLAESPDGFEPPWGGHLPPSTLNPLDPGSIELVASLYDELLPHFSSRIFNVGGDEPWELGKGKSKPEVDKRGGRVYLEYMLKVYNEVTARHHQVQFWADIIVKYPDLVPELPKDITAMIWGYEGGDEAAARWDHECKLVSSAGVPFYVCPGTSSWNSLAGRTDNSMDNCRLAAESGLKYGATGYLNTDWGDNGHWQPLSSSYLGFAYGAAVSWCYETNHDLDMPRALDLFAFEDQAGVMGKIAYDLGNVYLQFGDPHINGGTLVYALQLSREDLEKRMAAQGGDRHAIIEQLHNVAAHINTILAPINQADMRRPDAALIRGEFSQVAALLRHSIDRICLLLGDEERAPDELGAELQGLVDQQRTNWLARNRPGGLDDSINRFNKRLDEYQQLAVNP